MEIKDISKPLVDFARSGEGLLEKHYRVEGFPDDLYTVTIVRNRNRKLYSSLTFESLATTLNTMPAGTPCPACSGSGRL